MEPSLIIQSRKELEALKQFRIKNASNRFSYIGYIGELLVGIFTLGLSISLPKLHDLLWPQWLLLTIGILLIAHSLYLIFRFHYDKRIIGILELLLSDSKNVE